AGERYFGKARHCDHAVGLTIGTGLGAGIIANGRLYSGAVCGAGEFGMLPYKDRNFEFYASGQYFKNVHRASGKLLFEKARSGDADARRAFSEFGTHLGEAIKAILYALDPEIIILGGSISRAHAFFKAAMWKAVRGFAYTPTVERIRIEVSGVKNIAVLGAAALFLDAAERTGTVKPSGARLKK
ncbi:MAG TPA: ROK family protein, partial [Candidatus Aminicenantes bacterium]|nr:ROK family protein [Candidatus Aminicenantes bacterium]